MRRTLPLLVIALGTLGLVGCGDDDGGSAARSDDRPSQDAGSSDAGGGMDPALCSEFDESEGPTDELRDALPEQYRGALDAVAEFGRGMDALSGEDDPDAVTNLAATLQGKAAELEEFATFVEEGCPDTDGAVAVGAFAMVAGMVDTERDDEYCDLLERGFDSENEPEPDALLEVAPEGHVEALELVRDAAEAVETGDDSGADERVFGAALGLGLYAEVTCEIPGSAAQMMLAAAFMGMGGELEPGDLGGEGDSPTTTVDPSSMPPADVTAANAAVPVGVGLTFTSQVVMMQEDGTKMTAVPVPDRWELETFIDVSFSPPLDSGWSIFTSMDLAAGCDGNCQATDWEARLRGNEGYLSAYLENNEGASEAPIAGSEGVVATYDNTDGAGVLVLRWDDAADHFFRCEVSLEPEEAAQLPAFTAACVAARPSWIAVA